MQLSSAYNICICGNVVHHVKARLAGNWSKQTDPRAIETSLKTPIDFTGPEVMACGSFIVAFSASVGWTEKGKHTG